MVRVKMCGNQTRKDIDITGDADSVGFIVATPESSRNITPKLAARLAEDSPLFCSTVLVTTEREPRALRDLSARIEPDYLQLHSSLSPEQIKKISDYIGDTAGIIGLLSIDDNLSKLKHRALDLANLPLEAILLDGKVGGQVGGTGRVHNWEYSREIRDLLYPFPVILAGGLDPGNVGEAINKVQPYGVDVATGIEDNGDKSEQKVERFLKEVKKCEA